MSDTSIPPETLEKAHNPIEPESIPENNKPTQTGTGNPEYPWMNAQPEEERPTSTQEVNTPPRVVSATTIKTQQLSPPAAQEDSTSHEFDADPFEMSDDTASLTESINSVNYQYRYENGRRYHGFDDAVYLLPNDEQEQERLEGQHQTWLMLLGGKLHLSPLKNNIQNVLDVATGTGNWAMDFADQYPSARVTGTDLSPIQPNFVPPNCTFIVEDSEGDWVWDEKFDFIHSRTLGSTWRNWPGYFRKCYDYLKPGGYLEIHEFTFPFHCDDGTAGPENPMMQWSMYFNEACAKGGVDIEQCANLDPWLREAGFVDVTKLHLKVGFSGWSQDPEMRRISKFYGKIFDWGVSMALLTRRLGWSREKAEVFLADVRKDAADTGVHAYIPLYVYTAKRPETAVSN
ncbi:S-adenosyl-L-methionine-dependent methyltransferase [Lepidopterella palustris CBS 459.81]|uniref:S-adenosyl-L-methionine-dependent methyltransferase n=1 Tax=Lepidopterella palustris CBS 459.81 TaxID=1314670 RepID=A0A8E2E714_9PEZI|nr:S-adenosyl-L-methionine-dependent methyltransferase [Lepidopterella palustris CBS 459.81]